MHGFVYVSATGATVARQGFAYASRLGLWGTGDFPVRERGPSSSPAMEAGGIAAMEMIVARDLKALGLYLARVPLLCRGRGTRCSSTMS